MYVSYDPNFVTNVNYKVEEHLLDTHNMSLDHLEKFLETFEKKVLHFFGSILRFFEVTNFENADFFEISHFELRNFLFSFFLS